MLERLEAEIGVREDVRIGLEGDSCAGTLERSCAGVLNFTHGVQRLGNLASLETDCIQDVVLEHINGGPL